MPLGKHTFEALLAVLAATVLQLAHAQSEAQDTTRRALLERNLQSEAFSLQLQQSQQSLTLPPGKRGELDSQHLEQRHSQEMLGQQQLQRLASPFSQGEENMERERRAQQLQFATPDWRPTLNAPDRWTPTDEPPPSPWTPTLR
jgi:hypothetical protein